MFMLKIGLLPAQLKSDHHSLDHLRKPCPQHDIPEMVWGSV